MSSEMRDMLVEVLDAINHPDFGDGISLATYNKARALLARTEAAMTNPENVGGLPELPKISPHDHPEPRTMMWSNLEIQWIQRYARAYGELCRAAPAGGDAAPDIKPDGFDAIEIAGCDDIEQLRSWAHCMRRERDNWRQRALDAEMELAGDNGFDPPDSAPAGSGEVEELAAYLDQLAVMMTPPGAQAAGKLKEAAALLRKLQQGADVIDEAREATSGHCEHRKKPGGCPFHNLQCGYPDCDRRPA